MNLKETCQMTDSEWEERQKARQEEIQACSEALAILSSDDAHDTFTRTFNFVQTKSGLGKVDARREAAANVLRAAALKAGKPQLATLAERVRLDAFTKVKAAIDEMIAALLKEKADEIKHKDFCTDGLNQNERAQELKARDIAELQAEIAEMQTQLKRAGEDREKENADFQTTIQDQRATQKLLNSALNVLKGVYAKKSLLQARARQEPAGPPPPPGFKKYEQSSGAGGVMGMLQQIINDAKQLE